jgi:hypothetical protein
MKWTVFDLEFTKLMPPFGDPLPEDLHIACASVLSTGESWPQIWYEASSTEEPGDYMSEVTLVAFLDFLKVRVDAGYKLATWGGSNSDWRILFRECGSQQQALVKELALNSIDIPMCSCMSIGVMMGLNAACMSLGFTLKDSDASANVPDLWTNPQGRQKVLQHVSNDSYATLLVLKHAETTNTLTWISQKGHLKTWYEPKFFTVRQCLALELPNVPWTIGPTQNAKLMARWLLLA